MPDLNHLFVVDPKQCTAMLTLIGDFGHYRETDSIIIEFFRAINLTLYEKSKNSPRRIMKYTPGFPHYDPETNLTTCIFRLSTNTYIPSESVKKSRDFEAKNTEMGKFMQEDFVIIEGVFRDFITKFISHIDGELSEFDKHHELLTRAKNALDPVDYAENQRKANALLEDFIRHNKCKVAHSKPRGSRRSSPRSSS